MPLALALVGHLIGIALNLARTDAIRGWPSRMIRGIGKTDMTEHEEDSRQRSRPTVRQLQIAVEQPDDADPRAIEYLERHPGIKQLLEQARGLELATAKFAKENPDFDWEQFARLVEKRARKGGHGRSL
jgi:hypothetical protein